MPLSKISRIIVVLPVTVLLGGCYQSQPDYTPFGDGMKAIGICLVVFGVVQALASLVMADDKKQKEQPPKRRKPRRNQNSEGGESK
jgi:hypothetical protein